MASSLNYLHHNIDDFNNCSIGNDETKLRVLQWNVRGINDLNKFDSVSQYMEMFKCSVDVIVMGETWLTRANCSLYKISGYNSLFSCRSQSNGGLAMFVKDNLSHRVIKNVSLDGYHHIHVEINIKGLFYDVHGIYRPPSYDFADFYQKIENIFSSTDCNHSCLIAGDVNVPMNNACNNVVLRYSTLLESYGFVCSNNHVTRPSSANILDHFICKLDDISYLRNDTIQNDISDHSIVISSLNLPSKKYCLANNKKSSIIVNFKQSFKVF